VKFKLETEFQNTEIGKIPREWRVKKLGELVFEMYYGLTAKAVNQPTGLRMLRTTDIKDNYRVDWDSLPYCEITDNRRSNIQKYLLRKNDLVVSRAGTTGMSILVDRDLNDVIFGSYLIKIKLNESVAYPKFIHYFMQSSLYWNQLLPKQAGSTLKNISLPILKNIITPLPPINEQKLIPEILSTLDSAIKVIDAGVVRLEGLKKALMRELLTGRIRVRKENGKTAFYREIEFQETEIGKIPKEWRIVKLNRIAQIIMGQSPPSETYNKDGIGMPFLQGKMEFGRIYPSPVMYTSDPIKIAESNDVLISVRAPVGDVNIAPYRICIGRGLAAIRFDPNQTNYMFFFYYFQSIKERLETLGKGSTFKAITKKDLEELTVLNPSLKEQKLIGEILSTVDRTIELYHEERIRLDRFKRVLMDLLLTGKIRVVEG